MVEAEIRNNRSENVFGKCGTVDKKQRLLRDKFGYKDNEGKRKRSFSLVC